MEMKEAWIKAFDLKEHRKRRREAEEQVLRIKKQHRVKLDYVIKNDAAFYAHRRSCDRNDLCRGGSGQDEAHVLTFLLMKQSYTTDTAAVYSPGSPRSMMSIGWSSPSSLMVFRCWRNRL